MYGNSMQALMPHYLEATMENFRANQLKLQETWQASMGPDALTRLAETNMAMFKAAANAFIPDAEPAPPPPRSASENEFEALKAQMMAMQKKLDELGK